MKIIGITGGSGSGKSTASKILEEKLDNVIYIDGDDLMHKFVHIHQKEIFEVLNISDDDSNWRAHLVESLDNLKIWVNIIDKDIEDYIDAVIKDNKNENSTIIIDWAFLPLLSYFKKCDITISIDCDYDIKLKRLRDRLDRTSNPKKWVDKAFTDRLKYSNLREFGYKSMYEIKNNGQINDFRHDIIRTLKSTQLKKKTH